MQYFVIWFEIIQSLKIKKIKDKRNTFRNTLYVWKKENLNQYFWK